MDQSSDSGATPFTPGSIKWPQRLLIGLFLLLTVAVALTRSENGAILGRYSRSWFAYQLFNLCTLALLVLSVRRERVRLLAWSLAFISTFGATRNGTIDQLAVASLFLASIRLLVGVLAIFSEFDRYRQRRPIHGAVLSLGMVVLLVSLLDIGLWGLMQTRSRDVHAFGHFREAYDLSRVKPDDVVLVGDSFVWGDGVEVTERFGNVLEELYRKEGRSTKVYSLGIGGASPERYIHSLELLPESAKAGVVIFSYYMNDIEARPRRPWMIWGTQTLWELGRSSLTVRAFLELRAKLETPTLEAYFKSLEDDYRTDTPSFPRRWDKLKGEMRQFYSLARARSTGRPLFLILPIMVDFQKYPMPQVHEMLKKEAEEVGYEVLDLLPEFTQRLKDGTPYRVTPNDNHFNPAGHRLTAELIKQRLDARKAPSQ